MIEIVNVSENWGIGREGDLLVHLKGDMKFFRTKTAGKCVLMGRKTLDSFPGGKPLKGRVNVVLTHDPSVIGSGSISASDAYYELSFADNGNPVLDRSVIFCAPDTRTQEERILDAADSPDLAEAMEDIRTSLRANAESAAAGEAASERRTLLVTVHTKEEAVRLAALLAPEDICVIGGASVYEMFLPETDTCFVTINDSDAKADRYFPDLGRDPQWSCGSEGEVQEEDGVHYRFTVWNRIAR